MAQRVVTQVENLCDICGNVIYDEVTHANHRIGAVFTDDGKSFSFSLKLDLQACGRSIDMVCKNCADQILRNILNTGGY